MKTQLAHHQNTKAGDSLDLSLMEENVLVQQIQNGNDYAMQELVSRNRQAVARVVKAMLGDTPEAEDVGQETFIRFWSKIDTYRYEAKVSTYLTRIAINLAINESRKQKRRLALEKPFETNQKSTSIALSHPSQHTKDEVAHLHEALSQLDDDQRAVVVMRMLQGYSTKDTAHLLDIPQGTVLSRLSRALGKLKIILEKLDSV